MSWEEKEAEEKEAEKEAMLRALRVSRRAKDSGVVQHRGQRRRKRVSEADELASPPAAPQRTTEDAMDAYDPSEEVPVGEAFVGLADEDGGALEAPAHSYGQLLLRLEGFRQLTALASGALEAAVAQLESSGQSVADDIKDVLTQCAAALEEEKAREKAVVEVG